MTKINVGLNEGDFVNERFYVLVEEPKVTATSGTVAKINLVSESDPGKTFTLTKQMALDIATALEFYARQDELQ